MRYTFTESAIMPDEENVIIRDERLLNVIREFAQFEKDGNFKAILELHDIYESKYQLTGEESKIVTYTRICEGGLTIFDVIDNAVDDEALLEAGIVDGE